MNNMKRRLERLEQKAGATQGPIVIRVLYENALDGTTELAPWHVEVHSGVSRVVHEGADDARL